MTSGAGSSGGKQLFSFSSGGSVNRLHRHVCRIWDLTMGWRLGRSLLEKNTKIPDFLLEPVVLE